VAVAALIPAIICHTLRRVHAGDPAAQRVPTAEVGLSFRRRIDAGLHR